MSSEDKLDEEQRRIIKNAQAVDDKQKQEGELINGKTGMDRNDKAVS